MSPTESSSAVLRQRQLSELVYKDDLTEFFNRRHLRRYLSSALAAPGPPRLHSIVMLDVDQFKDINDAYGHECGDKALRHMASVLRTSFRESDVLVRYAGDEFVVVLPDTEKAKAAELAQQFQKNLAVSPYVHTDRQPRPISVSGGVASYPQDAENADELLERASEAVYHAKQGGRNRIFTAGDFPELALTERELLARFPCPDLVGRAELLRQLLGYLPGADEGPEARALSFVVLKGPAGIGKSRLLSGIRGEALKRGLIVQMTTCGEGDTMQPYQCFIRLLSELLSQDPDMTEKVTAGLPNESLFCMKRFMPRVPIKREVTKTVLTANTQRLVMFKTIVDLVAGIARIKPLVLIFDQLHYMDLGSLILTLALRNRGVPNITVYGAWQPSAMKTPLGVFFAVVKREHLCREFEVPPLSAPECKEMIWTVLPDVPDSPVLERYVWSATRGNPLFIESQLKSLIAQQQICIREGAVHVDMDPTQEPPQSMADAVVSTLETLDEETASLVTDAAVVGTEMEFQLLLVLAGLNQGYVQELLDKAEKAAILSQPEAEGDRVKFLSETVREITYDQTDEERRRKTHGQVGQFLEEKHKDNVEAVAGTLAHHYGRSDRPQKAAEFQAKARVISRLLFDPSEATLMATKKLAAEIPPADRPLSAQSASKILPFFRTLLEAVSRIRAAASGVNLSKEQAPHVTGALIPILANDSPLTIALSGEDVMVNNVAMPREANDRAAEDVREALVTHNAKSITFQAGIEDQEVALLLEVFARHSAVHVGLLWPVWLGEHDIRNCYVSQEIQTARLIQEGGKESVSLSGMLRGSRAAGLEAGAPGPKEAAAPEKKEEAAPAPAAEGAASSKAEPAQSPSAAPAARYCTPIAAAFMESPARQILERAARNSFLQGVEDAMVVGDQEALAAMVVPVKKCLSDPSVEVRSYAAVLLEAILAKCATHECAYLEDLLTGLLCEALGREESPRVHGRLSKVACEAVNRSQEHSDYEKVRRLLGALNPSEPSDLASRGISAQRAAILGQLLEMQFFDLVVEDLISGDAFRESAAGFVLASFKEMVVPRAVQAVCESEDVRVQTALLPILKSQPATTLAHVKERMTAGGGPGELKRMIGLAAKMLPEGQEILSLALEQPEEVVATEAVRAMAHLPPDECVRALVGLLTHPRSAVCREALRQIGELRLTDVEGDVNRMVSSDSVELASEACKTLGLIGTAESVSTLCKALRSRGFLGFFGGLSPVVRAAAASALGQIGTPHALADLQRAARERNAMVRESAKSALESFGRREDRPQGRGDPGTSL